MDFICLSHLFLLKAITSDINHYPPVTRYLALVSKNSNAERWKQYNSPSDLGTHSTCRMQL